MSVELTSLEGMRVLVSGGTTGIGRATVAQLAEAGAQVLTFGRHAAELKDSLAHAHQYSDRVYGLVADASLK
ncbi:MAG TPA: SDR family NAD(P)-dependent oxidoreductase, partial [Asticcacaulis sp.]|nr:SDR family NAD(P)-dependent oxidoreductase [Asticcacaulis sp.]